MSSRRGRGRGGKASGGAVSKELLKRSAAEAGLDDRHLKVLTDITKPPLFPPFLWHSAGGYWEGGETTEQPPESGVELARIKRPSGTVYTMNKQRELASRFQHAASYVPPTAPSDVARYDRHGRMPSAPDAAVLASLSRTNRKLATDPRYFPAGELILLRQRRKKHVGTAAAAAPGELSLLLEDDLAVDVAAADDPDDEAISKTRVATVAAGTAASSSDPTSSKQETAEDDEVLAGTNHPDEEEAEGEDYTTNYYNTDDESDAGEDGDAEPTF